MAAAVAAGLAPTIPLATSAPVDRRVRRAARSPPPAPATATWMMIFRSEACSIAAGADHARSRVRALKIRLGRALRERIFDPPEMPPQGQLPAPVRGPRRKSRGPRKSLEKRREKPRRGEG